VKLVPPFAGRDCECVTVTIMDVINRHVFYLKQNVAVTGFCLRVQVEPSHEGPVNRAILCLRTPAKSKPKLLYD
jgi:hypothetical protein